MSKMHLGQFSKVSVEYSSVGSSVALYTLHFMDTLIPCCDHTRFQSPPKAP